MSAPHWGNLNELAAVSGFARRTLQYMAKQEPGVLVTREKARKIEYDLGACNVNLRKREADDAVKKALAKVGLGEGAEGEDGALEPYAAAERRKMTADASLAELKLKREEGALVPLDSHLDEIDGLMVHMRAALIAHPRTRDYAPEILAALQKEPPPLLAETVAADAEAVAA